MGMRRALCAAAAGVAAAASGAAAPAYDVVVYGASPAGISAAITAAAGGNRSVALVEPLRHISGMGATGGLGLNDQQTHSGKLLTGLALEWARRNGRHYDPGNASAWAVVPDMWVGQASWEAMVAEARSVAVFTSCVLTGADRVPGSAPPLVASLTANCSGAATQFAAPLFIDASYDGDLMVAAGVAHTAGREPATAFNESLAGVQPPDGDSGEAFAPLQVPVTWPNGSLIPGLVPGPMPPRGTGDGGLMAFQYRLCLTTDAGNRVPFSSPPPGYRREDYELLARTLAAVVAAGQPAPTMSFFTASGGYSEAVARAGRHKYLMCCGGGPVNSDGVGLNAGWAAATHEQRRVMAGAHRAYLEGSLHFLATDPAVPPATRADVGRYGLCADEWTDNGHFPHQLYVRESNRLVGSTVLTQNTIANPRSKPDAVAVGCWEFDKHLVTRYAVANATGALVAVNEGWFRGALNASGAPCSKANCTVASLWYDVPYGVIVPRPGDVGNLLVPVALSASSVAFASARIETMLMGLGAAAGAAAGQVLAAGGPGALPVQAVDVPALQATLAAAGWMVRGPPPE